MSRIVGDTTPPLQGTCWGQASDGTSLRANLTLLRSLTVDITRPDGTVIARPGTVAAPATNGNWTLSLIAGDLTVQGTYLVKAVVIFADGTQESFGPAFFPVSLPFLWSTEYAV